MTPPFSVRDSEDITVSHTRVPTTQPFNGTLFDTPNTHLARTARVYQPVLQGLLRVGEEDVGAGERRLETPRGPAPISLLRPPPGEEHTPHLSIHLTWNTRTHAHARARTHARTHAHARTHTRAHTHTQTPTNPPHTNTHTHTHTHTHTRLLTHII